MTKRRNFSSAFKAKVALKALRGDQTLAELAGRYKAHPNLITKWRRQASAGLVDVFSGKKWAGTAHRNRTDAGLDRALRQIPVAYAPFGGCTPPF